MQTSREQKFEMLRKCIEAMDAGTVQVHVYKGMPVKIRLVGKELVLDGETILDLNQTEEFSPRKWWKNSP